MCYNKSLDLICAFGNYQAGLAEERDKSMAQSSAVPSVTVSGQKANKKIKFIVGGVIIALAVVYLIYTGIQSTSAYFLTVDELYAKGEAMENRTLRVSGKVDEDTIDFNNRDLVLAFEVTSETGERLPVVFNGPKPDQMRHGADAILEGKYDGQTFAAQSLLLKCPSRYEEGTIEEVQVEAVR
jgi:cytochrome c-type biogenesis protein CcmE